MLFGLISRNSGGGEGEEKMKRRRQDDQALPDSICYTLPKIVAKVCNLCFSFDIQEL